MSDAHPQVTALLARFILETKIEAIPENVRREGIRSLVNIIGCALGGSRHDAVNKAWAALQPFAGGEQATLIGRSQRTDALTAAFINTLSCSINAFDDTHAEAIVHPSGPVMAAVLAVAEMQPVTGAEALAIEEQNARMLHAAPGYINSNRIAIDINPPTTPAKIANTRYIVPMSL